MSQRQAILHLMELDPYHRKLVPTLLEMLRPRLARAWCIGVDDGADAVMVDVDSSRGREIVAARVDAGLGGRTIALGTAPGDRPRALSKPLRLHALLAVLDAIGTDASGPSAATAASLHYRVERWPELDPRTTNARLRVLSLLGRRPQTVAEVAARLQLDVAEVQPEVEALWNAGVLVPAPAPVALPPPRPMAAGRGLVSMLRQRFGL